MTNEQGSTDLLRFWRTGVNRPVVIEQAAHVPGMQVLQSQLQGGRGLDWRSLKALMDAPKPEPGGQVEIAPNLLTLGRFISRETRLPLEILEERIAAPSSG